MSAAVLSGWGRVPVVPGVEVLSEDLARLTEQLRFARGLGRAYGDAALPAPGETRIAGTRLADRILSFDEATGELTAEAGLSLDDICRTFLPRGFFVPVTPGTRFVTLGGMVACDVHGKNHHRDGTFGRYVTRLTLRVGDGRIVTCSLAQHEDLFRATIGGMGLTGAILEVTCRLVEVPTPWIYEERQPVHDIDEFLDRLAAAAPRWPMTVGWIDCLAGGADMGRGVLYSGRWAEASEAPAQPPPRRGAVPVPIDFPAWALGPLTVRAFNAVNYRYQAANAGASVVHPYKFFYPLDAIEHWTRMYGRRGFCQYQCVIPESAGRAIVRRFLELLTRMGGASFLCVIKDCGPEGIGMLSFPRPGTSIALDIPMRDNTQALVDALNKLLIEAGGRIYLAKDALTRAEHFRAMEPRLDQFLAVRRRWDPDGRIRSAQSVRLFGW
jgi:decaprenylphospho-beta-D-ribofuranose 2-oxidase